MWHSVRVLPARMDEPTALDPSSSLAIILGASAWPGYPDLSPSSSFKRSAVDFGRYLIAEDGCGLRQENVLDLFDAPQPAVELLSVMAEFLQRRRAAIRRRGGAARDLLIYYVGHGGFANPSSDYYLAIRSTNRLEPYLSSLPIISLARVLREEAREMRRYVILDSCFSAAAYRSFQESPLKIASLKAEDALPESGTALLCSSGPRDPSKAPPGLTHTMFTGAMIEVLRDGDRAAPPKLSLQDLADAVRSRLREQFADAAARPEVHAPEQRRGSVDRVLLFRNPGYRGGEPQPAEIIQSTGRHEPVTEQRKIPTRRIQWQSERRSPFSRLIREINPGLIWIVAAIAGLMVAAALLSRYYFFTMNRVSSPIGTGIQIEDLTPEGTKPVSHSGEAHPSLRLLFSLRTQGSDRVALTPDGARVITAGGWKLPIVIWDTRTQGILARLPSSSNWVAGLAMRPDGTSFASAHSNGNIQVWTTSGNHLSTFKAGSVAYSLAFSADGRFLAAGYKGKAVIWDLSTERELTTLRDPSSYDMRAVAVSPNAKYLATPGNPARLWEVPQNASTIPVSREIPNECPLGLSKLSFSSNGQWLAGSCDNERAWILRVVTGEVAQRLTLGTGLGYSAVAFSPRGTYLAAAGADHLELRSPQVEAPLATLKASPSVFQDLAFSRDGELLARAAASADAGTLELWKVVYR
jgi:hypothetical protein